MMRQGRIRCRSLSRHSSLGTVLRASRQAMEEGEGQHGCSACLDSFSLIFTSDFRVVREI